MYLFIISTIRYMLPQNTQHKVMCIYLFESPFTPISPSGENLRCYPRNTVKGAMKETVSAYDC